MAVREGLPAVKLLVTTVREFPAERRGELISAMVAAHHSRGDHKLAVRLAPLETEDRVEIRDGHGDEWVVTIYEVVRK